MATQVKSKVFTRPIKTSKMGNDLTDSHQQSFINPNLQEVKRPIVKHQTTVGFQRANYEIALQNKKATLNRYYKGEQVNFGVDLSHFKIYGPGIYLFFQFLWKLSILFFVLTLISLVPCIYNYLTGTQFQKSSQTTGVIIAKFSIGNYNSSDQATPKLINVISDMVISVCVIAFYFYWTFISNKKTEQLRKTVKLANYNVIELVQFPKQATAHDIFKFFSNFGNVIQVAPVQNYAETIQLSRQIYEIQLSNKQHAMNYSKESNQQILIKIQKNQKILENLYKSLQQEQNNSTQEVLKYYISFSTPQQRNSCLQRFKKFSGFCLCCTDIPEELKLLGRKIEIIPCHNQPGQILWQNCHITWKTRWMRWIIQMIILLMIIACAFFVISTLNILTPQTSTSSIDTSSYTSTTILSQTNSTIIQTWCLKNTGTALSGSAALYDLCYNYIKNYYLSIAQSFGIAFIIVIVKLILKKLVIFIAQFQRYKQYTQQSIDITRNLIILYIITTVIIGLLLQSYVLGIQFKNLIPSLTDSSYLSGNANDMDSYSDFDNTWYTNIGYQIWITWIILAVSPHIAMPIYFYIMECWGQFSAKKQILQKKMQKVMQASEFQIQDHYANIVMVFMIGIIFCGGMPLMIGLSFIGIISRYIYFKFIFIRFCKIPRTIDQALNETVLTYFTWTMVVHFLISIWMFGVLSVFNTSNTYFLTQSQNATNDFVKVLQLFLFKVSATSYYTIFAVVCLGILLLKEVVYNFIISCIFKKNDDQNISMQFKGQQTADNFMAIKSQRGITSSYKIQNNPEYFQILAIKNKIKKKKLELNQIQLE